MILRGIPLAREVLQELLIGQTVSKQDMVYIHPLVCWKEITVMMCFFVVTWQVSFCLCVCLCVCVCEREREGEK